MCFPKAPQPERRDPGAETAATLRAQREMELGVGQFADLGPRIESERKLQPQYTQLEIDRTRGALGGDQGDNGLIALMRQYGPELAAIQNQLAAQQYQDDIANVERLAPARGHRDFDHRHRAVEVVANQTLHHGAIGVDGRFHAHAVVFKVAGRSLQLPGSGQ